MQAFSSEFTRQCIKHIQENTPRIAKCLDHLQEHALWQKPNEASNSIGNIILHLCGNITQYIISALGGEPDNRHREEEFSVTGGYDKKALMEKLEQTVAKACSVIEAANEEVLLRQYSVQGFDMSGIGIVIHVTEHYSYHTGQLAFWTKLLSNKDLGFYAGIDLNRKNKV